MKDKTPDTPASLARSVRALLEWEQSLGGLGLPPPARPALRGSPPFRSSGSPAAAEGLDAAPERARPARPGADRRATLDVLRQQVAQCRACDLHKARTQTVFARGSADAELMFVGEGPGRDEDRLGEPFVGAAGQLLDKMVAAMGFSRDAVYVANVVKCRPPNNRTPLPNEAGACEHFLRGQIEAVSPRVLVALGRCAAEHMGLVPPSGGRWRGRWGSYLGIPVMPTYHPAFLLRSPEFKRPVWDDLRAVLARLGREVPAGNRRKDG